MLSTLKIATRDSFVKPHISTRYELSEFPDSLRFQIPQISENLEVQVHGGCFKLRNPSTSREHLVLTSGDSLRLISNPERVTRFGDITECEYGGYAGRFCRNGEDHLFQVVNSSDTWQAWEPCDARTFRHFQGYKDGSFTCEFLRVEGRGEPSYQLFRAASFHNAWELWQPDNSYYYGEVRRHEDGLYTCNSVTRRHSHLFRAASISDAWQLWHPENSDRPSRLQRHRDGSYTSNFKIGRRSQLFQASSFADSWQLWQPDGAKASGTPVLHKDSTYTCIFKTGKVWQLFQAMSSSDTWKLWQPNGAEADACGDVQSYDDGSFTFHCFLDGRIRLFRAAHSTDTWHLWDPNQARSTGRLQRHEDGQFTCLSSLNKSHQLFQAKSSSDHWELWQPEGAGSFGTDPRQHADGSYTCTFASGGENLLVRARSMFHPWEPFFPDLGNRKCRWLLSSQDDKSIICCLDKDVFITQPQRSESSGLLHWTFFGSKINSPDSSVDSYQISGDSPPSSKWVLLKVRGDFYQIAEDGVDILGVTLSKDALTASVLARKGDRLMVSRFDCDRS